MTDVREAVLGFDRPHLAALGLAVLSAAIVAADVREFTDPVWRGSGGIALFRVGRPPETGLLDGAEPVCWWERLDDGADPTSLCEVRVPELPEQGIITRNIRGMEDGRIEGSVIGSQAEISRSVEALDEAGIDVLVERLADYRELSTPLDALTDRQREVVRTAHELGYYEVPRAVSTEEVAAELDLDPSTVVDHLQRAGRNLLDDLLAGEG